MNRCTRQSSCQSAQPDFTCLKDCETRSDNGHISFIEISERLGGGLTNQASSDAPTCMATLLNRHLSDTRQWCSVLWSEAVSPITYMSGCPSIEVTETESDDDAEGNCASGGGFHLSWSGATHRPVHGGRRRQDV